MHGMSSARIAPVPAEPSPAPALRRAAPHSSGDLDLARVAAAYRGFLEALGLDLSDPDLVGTDRRVARAYRELLGGLRPDSEPALTTFPNPERYSGIIAVTGIPFYSICAHHFLPFFGTAHDHQQHPRAPQAERLRPARPKNRR